MDNHYEMLGIARSATALEIKTAFQTKMKALEASDVHGERRETQEKLLQQAFLTLLDPGRRAKYDKQIDTPVRRPVARRDEGTGVSVPTVVFVGALLAAIMAG